MQKASHLKTRTGKSTVKLSNSGVGKNISLTPVKKNGVNSSKRSAFVKTTVKKNTTKDNLTKSFLETAAQKSMQEAAEETMEVMGYNVIARDGWIVKVFKDKHVEKIALIPQVIEKI